MMMTMTSEKTLGILLLSMVIFLVILFWIIISASQEPDDDGDYNGDDNYDYRRGTSTAVVKGVSWKRHLSAAVLPITITIVIPTLLYLGSTYTITNNIPGSNVYNGDDTNNGIISGIFQQKLSYLYYEYFYYYFKNYFKYDQNNVVHLSLHVLSYTTAVLLGMMGLLLLVWTNRLFHQAHGTLGPWDPPSNLVLEGPYQHVRNPMLAGVNLVLFMEAVLVWNHTVLIALFGAVFFVMNTLYFKYSEEPTLVQRFGGDYQLYRQHVPMWIPNWTPYDENQHKSVTYCVEDNCFYFKKAE